MSGLPTLFDISSQFRGLAQLADDEEIPPEVIRDTLEGLEGDLQVKATNVAKFVLGLEAEAEAMKGIAEAIKARGERRLRRAESIRAYILLCMQNASLTKISCPEFTLSVRRNPKAVEIEDVTEIPPQYMVQPEPPPPRPDKDAIKKDIEAGIEVKGAWLRQGEHLRITV